MVVQVKSLNKETELSGPSGVEGGLLNEEKKDSSSCSSGVESGLNAEKKDTSSGSSGEEGGLINKENKNTSSGPSSVVGCLFNKEKKGISSGPSDVEDGFLDPEKNGTSEENETTSSEKHLQEHSNKNTQPLASIHNGSNSSDIRGDTEDKIQIPKETKTKARMYKSLSPISGFLSSGKRGMLYVIGKKFLHLYFASRTLFQRKKRTYNKDESFYKSWRYSRQDVLIVYPVLPTGGIGNMRIRNNRLRSLETLNEALSCNRHPTIANIGTLASSGFYYCGSQGKILCFSCGSGLPLEEVISTIPDHKPNCDHNREVWRMDGAGVGGQIQESPESNALASPSQERARQNQNYDISGFLDASTQVHRTTTTAQRRCSVNSFGFTVSRHREQSHGYARSHQGHPHVDVEASANMERLRIGPNDDTQRQEDEDVCVLNRRRSAQTTNAQVSFRLREENRRVREMFTCKICGDRRVKIVFLPCSHLITCEECSILTQTCPFCKQAVTGRTRITEN